MAGRKHHLQGYGINAGQYEFNNIQDPIERDLAFHSINVTPYCVKCGQQILMPAREERRDYQLEVRVQMHEDCLRDYEADMRAKAAEEKAKKQDFDLEAYARNFFKDKE